MVLPFTDKTALPYFCLPPPSQQKKLYWQKHSFAGVTAATPGGLLLAQLCQSEITPPCIFYQQSYAGKRLWCIPGLKELRKLNCGFSILIQGYILTKIKVITNNTMTNTLTSLSLNLCVDGASWLK